MTIPPALTSVLCVALVAGVASFARAQEGAQEALGQAQAEQRAYSPREMWAVDFLGALGNAEPTGDTVAMVVEWTLAEDSGEGAFLRNNPLNTTQPGFAETVTINSDGVKGYESRAAGLDAAVHTITNGLYDEVVRALLANDAESAKRALWASPWAGSHYGYGSGWPTYQTEETRVTYAPRVSSKCVDPIPDWQNHINAGFYATNCDAWGMQPGCQHFGTDIGGSGEGTPVQAPCSGTYTGCQDNGDSGPYIGKWIEYTTDDGAQFLINHFRDSPLCGAPSGTRIEAGDFIGTMRGDANHIHVQVVVGGQLVDFERYFEEAH